jgi:hypothetical protein
MDLGIVNTTLQSVAKLINEVKTNVANYYTNRSLSDITKLTRVEPLAIVSKDCVNLEYMPYVMNSLLSMFAGHYLRAVDMLTKVNDVEVIKVLDRLNPDRDETGFLLSEQVSREAVGAFSMEACKHSLLVNKMEMNGRNVIEGLSFEDDNSKLLNESVNLSVGKQFMVDITFNKERDGIKDDKVTSVKIPVNIRLLASVIPDNSILKLLTYKTDDESLVERFHSWRAGRISFIRDLIFCQDLIDEVKRANIGDETGTMAEVIRRVNNAKKYGLLTKNPSLVSASNLYVISEEVARNIETKLGGKLSNAKVRERAFENTYAMIIAVIERDWKRVTFYTRGVSAGTDVSIDEIKMSSKGKGPDIADIMRAMNMGIAPSF